MDTVLTFMPGMYFNGCLYSGLHIRVRISGPRIAICGSNVFSRITLSGFYEIHELKLSFCWNFCLQGNHKVFVYTSSSTLPPKSVKLYTIFWQLNGILAPNPQWGLTALPIPSDYWNFSLNLCGSLLKRKFEPCMLLAVH